jgi:hypothetical protein
MMPLPPSSFDGAHRDAVDAHRVLASLASQSLGIRGERALQLAERYLDEHEDPQISGFLVWIARPRRHLGRNHREHVDRLSGPS